MIEYGNRVNKISEIIIISCLTLNNSNQFLLNFSKKLVWFYKYKSIIYFNVYKYNNFGLWKNIRITIDEISNKN